MRLTKVILHILRAANSSNKEESDLEIVKFDKIDLFKLLFNRMNEKISIADFCLAHGYFDIHKIITSFYDEVC